MKNSKTVKNTIRFIIGISLGIIVSAIGVYAATKYDASDVYYDNSNSSLMNIDTQGAVDELADKYKSIGKPTECPNDTICLDAKTTLALGDYVKMTPTKSSYTTDTSKTGYSSTQKINPQELNLWRVISLNDDGTVDIVSEHVSSTAIYFKGQTGYQNLVGYLNVLASQYENSTYTKGSRYFGYNGQTEYITNTSKFTNPAPWTCSTGSCNSIESQGGGDALCAKDYNLVKSVLGTTSASEPDGTNYYYWMASRYYNYYSATDYRWAGRGVDASGSVNNYYDLYYYNGSGFGSIGDSNSLRPVLTLKSGLKYSGLGTEAYPMEISLS